MTIPSMFEKLALVVIPRSVTSLGSLGVAC